MVHALSYSLLRRHMGYWNAHRELTEREAMGTHGGNYAEEMVASILRGLVNQKFEVRFEVRQNVWLRELQREPDISVWESDKLCAVVEVKTVLDKSQWTDVKEQRNAYLMRHPDADFRLVALRASGLSNSVKEEINKEAWACVLWNKSGAGGSLLESDITIWKPIEEALEAAMEHLQLSS